MCAPGCQEHLHSRFSRRGFLKAAGAMTALAAAACSPIAPAPPRAPTTFTRAVDLTHTIWPDFPTYFGVPQLQIEVLNTFADSGFNMNNWHIGEHTGTHMDAPFHFSADGLTADAVPIANLVVPLAVVDIRAKAAANPDAQLTPDDLLAWEAAHGRVPEGACVAMLSGWDAYIEQPMFRNADANGGMHFPGIHAEAAGWLIEERNVVGIAVDTLSLDYGQSADFATHYAWLPTNRWGLENVANLADLPAKGATLVVGGPKILGATGGPSRVIALV